MITPAETVAHAHLHGTREDITPALAHLRDVREDITAAPARHLDEVETGRAHRVIRKVIATHRGLRGDSPPLVTTRFVYKTSVVLLSSDSTCQRIMRSRKSKTSPATLQNRR